MVKVWKDLNDLTFAEVPNKLVELDKSMKAIPKHDNNVGARKVYQKEEYSIYKVDNCFIIHNTNKDFKDGHSHIKSFNTAKTLVDNCIRKRIPKTRNHYLLQSIIRISNDVKYIDKIETLREVRENKELNKYIVRK